MANSDVDICNMALGHLGADPIVTVDQSVECETHYETVRDSCLEDRDWTFAMRRKTLGSPSTETPAFGYNFQYLLPTDIVRLVSVNGNEYDWVKEGRYVLTDGEDLEISYVYRVEDVRQFSATFTTAFAMRLASAIAIPITNSVKIAAGFLQMYQQALQEASSNDGRQGRNRTIRRNVVMKRSAL